MSRSVIIDGQDTRRPREAKMPPAARWQSARGYSAKCLTMRPLFKSWQPGSAPP